MNYRHAYHAGSFADVFKHILLMLVIESLLKKEKPFCYLDTHAGIGKYDLKSIEAEKTREFETGIGRLLLATTKVPQSVADYCQIVKNHNQNGVLKWYPGSPRIVRPMLRPNDKMILTELHPIDCLTLKEEFKHDKQVAVHLLDGYQGLKAFLPPNPRRGVVLIDPPYEDANEFNLIVKNLLIALDRWSQGIFLIWYPVKNRYQITNFEQKLKKSHICNVLMTELNLYPDDAPLALNGSGMVVINPPWKLAQKLSEILPWLLHTLDKTGRGSYRIEHIA